MYFRQTNPVFEKKNRNLDKQTTPSSTIKHQRDKQIFIVCRADVLWCYMVRFVCLNCGFSSQKLGLFV